MIAILFGSDAWPTGGSDMEAGSRTVRSSNITIHPLTQKGARIVRGKCPSWTISLQSHAPGSAVLIPGITLLDGPEDRLFQLLQDNILRIADGLKLPVEIIKWLD
jgi:hypothetical protein